MIRGEGARAEAEVQVAGRVEKTRRRAKWLSNLWQLKMAKRLCE
jgi:hypothetical protein